MISQSTTTANEFTVTLRDGNLAVEAKDINLPEAFLKAQFRLYCLHLDCKKIPCIIYNRDTEEVVYFNYKARLIGVEAKGSDCSFTYATPFDNLYVTELHAS
jgi:hypothetical protein